MAEKKDVAMNTFPQVTNAEYVYAEAADGSQVKIKVSDILGGVLVGVLKETILPSSDSNVVGDYDELDSGYGYYNNSRDTSGQYAPARTAGLFIRFKLRVDSSSTTLFVSEYGGTKLWCRRKGGVCMEL